MKNSPHNIKHQQKKAIRSAQDEEYQTEEKQIKEKAIKRGATSEKTNKTTKGKIGSKKKSHKTTPGEVTWETEPDSIHREGGRWIQTIQKQTLDAAGRLQKKLRKFFKKK